MNAPVTPSPVRSTSTGSAASRSSSPSSGGDAFASMLDDVLSTDRPSGRGPSDRGIERRSTPDDRAADRAAERASGRDNRDADAADRAADKADRAEGRAAHRAQRTAAHAAQTAHRAGKAA